MPRHSTEALRVLAQHVHADRVRPDRLGADLVERLSLSLLDLLGCHLASMRLGANNAILHATRPVGSRATGASLWSSHRRVAPMDAALVNGTIAHHAEFDGGWHGPPRVGAHPAVTVLPAAMAVAESCQASGQEFVAAVAAGYDVLAAMARCLSPAIVEHRLHPPGLLGSFGAAAAASRLWRRSLPATARALSICGGVSPLCPFESFTAGATAKDLYGGWPAAVGIMAALETTVTEHPFSLPELLGRPPLCPSEIEPHLDTPALADADFKAYPACRTVHPALTALESLLEREAVEADAVQAMEVETYAYAVELDAVSDIGTPIGARTSVLMCLALRLHDGPLQAHHFTTTNLRRPALRALCDRSRILVGRYSTQPGRGATVLLRMRDGRRLSHSVSTEKWSRDQPASSAQVIGKFRRQAAGSLVDRDCDELIDRVLNVHRAPSLRGILDVLERSRYRDTGENAARAAPLATGADEHLLAQWAELLPGLANQGADAGLLNEAFGAARGATGPMDPSAPDRARSLALALLPASAGPVPARWAEDFGRYVSALSEAGFSGPARVVSGPRGLRHLAQARRR